MYHYSKATGEFVTGKPKGDGFGSTNKKPPKVEHNQSAIFVDGNWEVHSAFSSKTPEEVRKARDEAIEATRWLKERHEDEVRMEWETTLTEEEYEQLLDYRQYLRDLPQQENFPDIELLTFEEFKQ